MVKTPAYAGLLVTEFVAQKDPFNQPLTDNFMDRTSQFRTKNYLPGLLEWLLNPPFRIMSGLTQH